MTPRSKRRHRNQGRKPPPARFKISITQSSQHQSVSQVGALPAYTQGRGHGSPSPLSRPLCPNLAHGEGWSATRHSEATRAPERIGSSWPAVTQPASSDSSSHKRRQVVQRLCPGTTLLVTWVASFYGAQQPANRTVVFLLSQEQGFGCKRL